VNGKGVEEDKHGKREPRPCRKRHGLENVPG